MSTEPVDRVAPAPLAVLSGLVPFLRTRTEPEAGDLSASALAADPDLLAGAVAAGADERGSADPVVLASLWWQGYAYRTAGTTLACWALSGAAPDPAATSGVGVGVARGRPATLVVAAEAPLVADLRDLLARLFGAHLDLVAAALRARHRIGSRLVWGDAAAAVSSCLGAVVGAEGAPAGVGGRVDRAVAALPHGLAALGSWLEPHSHYRRTTCCLWWKTTTAAGAYCADCSLR